jgi:hypothetical protein
MSTATHCEACLRGTPGEACTRHPYADLLDAHTDREWLAILHRQKRSKNLKYLALGMLPLVVLFIALNIGPIGLATGILASIVMICAGYWGERSTPEDLAVLAEAPEVLAEELTVTGQREEGQLARERRNRRIEHANARDRRSQSSRVTMAG